MEEVEEETNENEQFKKQLQRVRKASVARSVYEHEEVHSGFELQEHGSPYSFCSYTISRYNDFLRVYFSFVVIYHTITLCSDSYIFFFQTSVTLYTINTSVDLLYMIVVILRARMGNMVNGVEERNLMKVRLIYYRSLAIILDLISFLPLGQLYWILPGSDEFYQSIGRQKQYLRLHFILWYIGLREKEPGSSTFLFRSIKYCILSVLTIQLLAGGWFFLACRRTEEASFNLSQCTNTSWIFKLPDNVLEKVWGQKYDREVVLNSEVSFLRNTYVTSLYWSSATATSTGYGDIHAFTVAEKVYSIFAMIIGMSILYGMTMGGMTSMLTNIDAQRSTFIHRYQAFQREVKRMKVSDNVTDMCLNYFEYIWYRWEGEDIYASGFLELLPESLRASFAEATFHKLLHKADLLQNTGDAFYRNLALVSKPMVYLENQFVQKSGEIADEMCYIQNGSVEVLDSDERGVIALMHPGKLFGQILLAFDLPRINSIKCKTNCDVFVLNKHDFRQVLSQYPDCAKKFVEAVRKKCKGSTKVWPMEAPKYDDFINFIEKKNRQTKNLMASIPRQPTRSAASSSVYSLTGTTTRRMTTVSSTQYKGVALPRLEMYGIKEQSSISSKITCMTVSDPSLVEFYDRNHPRNRKRHTIASGYSPGSVVRDLKFKEKVAEANENVWLKWFIKNTTVNPKGKFYGLWKIYMFLLSIISALFGTLMITFGTVVGQERTYIGRAAEHLDLLDISTYICNRTLRNVITATCSQLSFNETASCLQGFNTTFGRNILGNSADGYRITVPATYDLTTAPYYAGTTEGLVYIIVSYLVIDLSFLIGIFIRGRKAHLTPNGTVSNYKEIFNHYNKWNRLWLDVLCICPFEIFFPLFGCYRIQRYNAICFLRLNRTFMFLRCVPSSFQHWERHLHVKIVRIRTLKFVIYIYFITHLCACALFITACGVFQQLERQNITSKCRFGSWAWVYDISFNTSRYQDYVITMYWTSTTMTSTGYGDIAASTTQGRLFALFTMIVGTIMYGWLVAVIASTLSNHNSARVSFSNSMLDMERFLNIHSVSKALVDRALNVRSLEWHRYAGTAIPGKTTIGQELSEKLRNVLMYECVNKYIQGLPFFYGVDASFIAMLSAHVQIYHYCEGDVIIYEGDLSRNLYIVKDGSCFIVTQDLKEVIDQLKPGDYFGECETLFDCASPRTVIAETACELLVLQRNVIDLVLESFPYLQSQMSIIAEDTVHKNLVLEAIRNRKENKRLGVDMSEHYMIESLDNGIYACGKKKKYNPLVVPLAETDAALTSMLVHYKRFDKILSLLLLPFAFDPTTKGYLIYETFRSFQISATIMIVPLQIGFLPNNTTLMSLQYIFDICGLLNQYVKAHTCYFNKKDIFISHPFLTAKRYLHTSCLVDFLSWFPFELISYSFMPAPLSQEQFRMVCLLRVTRLLQFYELQGYFHYWLSNIRLPNRLIYKLRSILFGIFIHHWLACLLFLSSLFSSVYNNDAYYSSQPDMIPMHTSGSATYVYNNSWVGKIIVNNEFSALDLVNSVWDQYIISFYFATTTLVCTGYGDIHARQYKEMFATTVVMIVGTIFYSSILGHTSAYIQTDDIRRGHYKGRLSDIQKVFKVFYVKRHTQRQILNYYYYLWDRTRGVSPHFLLSGLPPSIRTSVCQGMYNAMIREAFEETGDINQESQGFFRLVSTHIKPSLFLQNSVIYRRDDIGEDMYFIQRGEVAILEEDDISISTVLEPGQHFGEIALLLAVPRHRTVKAFTNCDLNVLTKTDLDDILDKFPRFRKRMTSVAEDRSIKGPSSASYKSSHSFFKIISASALSENPMNAIIQMPEISDDVIHRDSALALTCNGITTILCFSSISLVIYQVCFHNHYITFYLLGYIMDCWFLLDMLIQFRSSFMDQFNTNIVDLKMIRLLYVKCWEHFCLDLLANTPVEVLSFLVSDLRLKLNLFLLLRLNRLIRFYRLRSIFKEWEKDIKKNTLLIRMSKFFLGVAFIMGFTSGLWYIIACPLGRCMENTWVRGDKTAYESKGINGQSIVPWVDSLYWTVATMTSTGYGDIKPHNRTEMLYACFVMVLGKLMIGYVLGMVAATLANDESLKVWYEKKVSAVKHYMKDLDFKDEIHDHVVQYYDYVWMKNQGVNVMELFPDLSFSLRADIYSQIGGDLVEKVQLFDGCPDNFMRHLCMVLIPACYMPGDYICFQGDIRFEMFIIHRGIAEALKVVKGKKIPLRVVMEGESILEESILNKISRPFSMRARTYVDTFSLTMAGLQSVMEYHPKSRIIIMENAKRLFPSINVVCLA